MENPDLYEDLNSIDLGVKLTKLEAHNHILVEKIKNLKGDVQRLCTELENMKQTESNLKTNISELFNSSKLEIARKDKQIVHLQRQIDDFIIKQRSGAPRGFVNHIKNEPDNDLFSKAPETDGEPISKRPCIENDMVVRQHQSSKSRSRSPRNRSQSRHRTPSQLHSPIRLHNSSKSRSLSRPHSPSRPHSASGHHSPSRHHSSSQHYSPNRHHSPSRHHSLSRHHSPNRLHTPNRHLSPSSCRSRSHPQIRDSQYYNQLHSRNIRLDKHIRRSCKNKDQPVRYRMKSVKPELHVRTKPRLSYDYRSKSVTKDRLLDRKRKCIDDACKKEEPQYAKSNDKRCSSSKENRSKNLQVSIKEENGRPDNVKLENGLSSGITNVKQACDDIIQKCLQKRARELGIKTLVEPLVTSNESQLNNLLPETSPTIATLKLEPTGTEVTLPKRRRCVIQLT